MSHDQLSPRSQPKPIEALRTFDEDAVDTPSIVRGREGMSTKTKLGLLLAGLGVAGTAGFIGKSLGDKDPIVAPQGTETSAPANPDKSTEAPTETFTPPSYETFDPLTSMEEQEWNDAVSRGILDQVSWYVTQKVNNPDADIARSFTDNPTGDFSASVDELALQISNAVGPNPENEIIVAVSQIAGDYDDDPEHNSSLVRDVVKYPDMSSLTAVFSKDPDHLEDAWVKLSDNYQIVQLEDGSLRIN